MGLDHKPIQPEHPESNGLVEKFNANLEKVMQTAKVESKHWRQKRNTFLRNYRATPQLTAKESPADLLFQTNHPQIYSFKRITLRFTLSKESPADLLFQTNHPQIYSFKQITRRFTFSNKSPADLLFQTNHPQIYSFKRITRRFTLSKESPADLLFQKNHPQI